MFIYLLSCLLVNCHYATGYQIKRDRPIEGERRSKYYRCSLTVKELKIRHRPFVVCYWNLVMARKMPSVLQSISAPRRGVNVVSRRCGDVMSTSAVRWSVTLRFSRSLWTALNWSRPNLHYLDSLWILTVTWRVNHTEAPGRVASGMQAIMGERGGTQGSEHACRVDYHRGSIVVCVSSGVTRQRY